MINPHIFWRSLSLLAEFVKSRTGLEMELSLQGYWMFLRWGLIITWGAWGGIYKHLLFSPANDHSWQSYIHGWILVILVSHTGQRFCGQHSNFYIWWNDSRSFIGSLLNLKPDRKWQTAAYTCKSTLLNKNTNHWCWIVEVVIFICRCLPCRH